jgi:NAD(P)-dependent dehydrogenase (short-subunit alcohol dehydrogenase family)
MAEDGTLDRYGGPIGVARTVEFLVSDAASFITGQVIPIDGGKQCFPAQKERKGRNILTSPGRLF